MGSICHSTFLKCLMLSALCFFIIVRRNNTNNSFICAGEFLIWFCDKRFGEFSASVLIGRERERRGREREEKRRERGERSREREREKTKKTFSQTFDFVTALMN